MISRNIFCLVFPIIIGVWMSIYSTNSHAQTRRALADSTYQVHLLTLKTGCLFVRLSDRASIRAKLVEHNETDKLRRFDLELSREFNEIISAFQKYYNFGKVYFFYRSETAFLKNSEFHKMTWLNSEGTKITSKEIDTSQYYIGEFGAMELQDSVSILDENGRFVKKEPKTSFQTFMLRDAQYRALPKQYAFHVRTILRTKTKVIRVFNARMERNYNSVLKLQKQTTTP